MKIADVVYLFEAILQPSAGNIYVDLSTGKKYVYANKWKEFVRGGTAGADLGQSEQAPMTDAWQQQQSQLRQLSPAHGDRVNYYNRLYYYNNSQWEWQDDQDTFHAAGANPQDPADKEQDQVLNAWKIAELIRKNPPQQAADAPATPSAGKKLRIEPGQEAILYDKRYTYDSAKNRWFEQLPNKQGQGPAARGQAHMKLMALFGADEYGVEKQPGMIARKIKKLSDKMGGEFGQGIDPDAGIFHKIGSTLGSMVGRGLGALTAPKQPQAAESIDLSRLRVLSGIDKNENL